MSHPIKRSDIIKQSNVLTTAAYSLSKIEKRLVYMGLNQITNKGLTPNELGQFEVDINHNNYVKTFDATGKNISRDILKASKDLNKREVIFYLPEEDGDDGEKALDAISWTTKRSHRPRRGTTTIYFNAELVKIIQEYDGNYTKFLMSEAGILLNPHIMRLYESLKQWSNRQYVTFSVDWICDRYELPKSYRRMSDFRRRFLHPAIIDINEKTALRIEATEIPDKNNPKRIKSIRFDYLNRDKLVLEVVDDTIELTPEAAIKTYSDIVNASRVPSLAELENLKSNLLFLGKEGFVFDEAFFRALQTAEEAAVTN